MEADDRRRRGAWRASGPRRENAADGSSLSKRATAAATLRVERSGPALTALVVRAAGRLAVPDRLERAAVEDPVPDVSAVLRGAAKRRPGARRATCARAGAARARRGTAAGRAASAGSGDPRPAAPPASPDRARSASRQSACAAFRRRRRRSGARPRLRQRHGARGMRLRRSPRARRASRPASSRRPSRSRPRPSPGSSRTSASKSTRASSRLLLLVEPLGPAQRARLARRCGRSRRARAPVARRSPRVLAPRSDGSSRCESASTTTAATATRATAETTVMTRARGDTTAREPSVVGPDRPRYTH